MGYSHYWYRIETPTGPLPPEPADAYARLAADTHTIVDAAAVELADGAATPGSRAVIDDDGIWLNSAPPLDVETFAWPSQAGREPWWTTRPGERWWDACKTNRQPYDLVVCAVLIRAGTHYGPSLQVSSDGAWDGSTIDGRFWPEWTAARRLVVDLFGPTADTNPLVTP